MRDDEDLLPVGFTQYPLDRRDSARLGLMEGFAAQHRRAFLPSFREVRRHQCDQLRAARYRRMPAANFREVGFNLERRRIVEAAENDLGRLASAREARTDGAVERQLREGA